MSRRPEIPEKGLRVLPGEGRRFAHFKQASVFYIILALAVLLIIQAGYHWMGPFILVRRLQIVTAGPGLMERRIEVAGLLTRKERLLTAPCTGVIIELAPSGERAAAGTAAAVLVPVTPEERQRLQDEAGSKEGLWYKIKEVLYRGIGGGAGREPDENPPLVTGELPPWSAERVTLDLPEAGLLLHRLDGWEGLDLQAYMSLEQYKAAAKEPFNAVKGLLVEEGQPILKLIDNWQWFYNILLPLDPGRTAAAQKKVTLEFAFAPEQSVTAELSAFEIDSEKEEVRLTYCIKEQFPGFEDLRWFDATIIYDREEGIVIPAAALVEREGGFGVFLNRGGMVKFNEVTVIRIQDGEAIVEGLDPYSMVISRPGLVEEGQRLN